MSDTPRTDAVLSSIVVMCGMGRTMADVQAIMQYQVEQLGTLSKTIERELAAAQKRIAELEKGQTMNIEHPDTDADVNRRIAEAVRRTNPPPPLTPRQRVVAAKTYDDLWVAAYAIAAELEQAQADLSEAVSQRHFFCEENKRHMDELEQAQASLASAQAELRSIHIALFSVRDDCTDGHNWRMMLGNIVHDMREGQKAYDTQTAAFEKAVADNQRLMETLERYGNHDIECKFNSVQDGHNGPCTCGYQAALDAAKGDGK